MKMNFVRQMSKSSGEFLLHVMISDVFCQFSTGLKRTLKKVWNWRILILLRPRRTMMTTVMGTGEVMLIIVN